VAEQDAAGKVRLFAVHAVDVGQRYVHHFIMGAEDDHDLVDRRQ